MTLLGSLGYRYCGPFTSMALEGKPVISARLAYSSWTTYLNHH